MEFGIFGGARQKCGLADTDSPTGYRDWINYNIEAEALDFCSSFTTEHHFTGLGQVSASLNWIAYLAAKTTTLRLGTAWRLFGKAGLNMSCCRMRAAGLLAFVNSPKRLFSVVRGHRGCGVAVLPSGRRVRRGAVRSVPASASDRTSGLRRQPQH